MLDSSSLDLVTIRTLPYLAALSAKLSPAMPDPMTKKSTFFINLTNYNNYVDNVNNPVNRMYKLS
ncbi:hypothetical protein D3C85_1657580 [compost metagenome]